MSDELDKNDLEDALDGMKSTAEDGMDSAKSAASDLNDSAMDMKDTAMDDIDELKSTIGESTDSAMDSMKETVGAVTGDDKLWGMLSWLFWPLAILSFFTKPDSKYIRYHAVHGLAVGLLFSLITVLTGGLGCITFIATIWFAIKAYQGEWTTVPVVTDLLKGQGFV